MTQLKSNITLEELSCLITDVAAGSAQDWVYLNTSDKAYVSVHEAIVYEDKELIKFSAELSTFLTKIFGKKVPTSRYNGGDAGYSVFSSLFTSQGGLVRILWLNGKILSVLIGAKPKKIISKDKKALTFSPSYFGLSKGSDAEVSLSNEDKDVLMSLHPTTWPVSNEKTSVGQRNDDYGKSFSVSKNYVRHGSIEKLIGSEDLNFLVYPKSDNNNLFNQGGSQGSGLPGLVNMISRFDYNDMLESNLLSGEWSRYRDYDNTVFLPSKDLTPYIEDKSYMKFSFDSLTKFQASKGAVKKKDIITRKHSVLTDVDTKKYFDNPKYHVVFSEDKLMYYICKSDKLKATALQTKITKSMREDFISFLNWIGYFSLAADLDPASMGDYFKPLTLLSAKKVTWANEGLSNLVERKDLLVTAASNLYRTLYMGETDTGSCNMLSSVNDMFKLIYQDCGSGSNFYHAHDTDPLKIIYFGSSSVSLVSFNKKFALDISLLNVMRTFCNEKVEPSGDYIGCNKLSDVIPFLNTNFLLSNSVEAAYEQRIKEYSENNRQSIPYWYLSNEITNEEQLLKTCITLSPETLAIFGSVASLSSPTDILSWLELSKEHFVTELPKRLVTKFGANIGDENTVSAIIENGITFYSLILSAAEPFSNKLLSPDSTDDETGD